MNNQRLFSYLSQELGATTTQLAEIAAICGETTPCSPPAFHMIKSMRTAQKNYFATPYGSFAKTQALEESKKYEKQVDAFIEAQEAKQNDPQLSLF